MLLGLTGGIATGKSTFRRFLSKLADFTVFDADSCVHELLVSDRDVFAAIQSEFPSAVSGGSKLIDRSVLRARVFADPDDRRRLEGILHPRVRQQWQLLLRDCRAEQRNFVADIPLLFETEASTFFDATVVVAASPSTQCSRLAARGIDSSLAEAMLASQWPIGQKIAASDFVIWNDGSLSALKQQAFLLLERLSLRAA